MVGDSIMKGLELRYDYYITTLGVVVLGGAVWLYSKFVLSKEKPDIIVMMVILSSMVIGFLFFLVGLLEMSNNYNRSSDISKLDYQITSILKKQELRQLKEKYHITDEKSAFVIMMEKLWQRIHHFYTKKDIKRKKP